MLGLHWGGQVRPNDFTGVTWLEYSPNMALKTYI